MNGTEQILPGRRSAAAPVFADGAGRRGKQSIIQTPGLFGAIPDVEMDEVSCTEGPQ